MSMSRVRLSAAGFAFIAVSILAASGMPPSSASSDESGIRAPFVPDEILLKFRPGARALDRASARAQVNAGRLRTFRGGAEHWKLGAGVSVEEAIEKLRRHPLVEYAEPNFLLGTDVVPNDPRLGELYGMINTGQTGGTADADIDADMAWNVSRGSRSVVVAVIDTGVDYNHPDLAANIWTNADEIPGNHVDDDANGYVDDVHGYDFVNNDGDPFDDNGHGTHCAGTIGAVGDNGVGVVGVNWEVSIMALKFLSAGGSGSTANAVLAVDYATANGAHLSSNSWGGGGFSQTLLDAIARASAADIPFIAAAGNNGTNNDTTPHYPSNYDLPNVISVAATDHNDNKASFSNYGRVTVDIGAPGVNILSTQPGGLYRLLSGTSMATPHVAGAAALIKSLFPGIPAAQLKTALLTSATPNTALRTDGPTPVASGGRLNAFFAIAAPDDVPPGAVGDLLAGGAGSNTMVLSWTATGDDGQDGTAAFYQVRYSTSPIDETSFGSATRAGNEPDALPFGSPQTMEVRGLDFETTYYFALKAFDEFGNPGPISNLAIGTTLPAPTVGLSPTSISEALFTGQTADHTVTLRNDGVGTLDFTIPVPALGQPLAVPYEPLVLDKDESDPRPGILGTGGPDAFGYRWTDSNQAGGPVFSWTDISTTGTLVADVTTDDDTSAPIALGFDFPFYGSVFNSFRVCSNGWLSFTSASTAYSNQPLPNTGAPENLIAPFWDDLHPGGVARIYYQRLGSRTIVQWHQMPRYQQGAPGSQEPGSSLTFQAILDASGVITFQYLALSGTLNSATVGIQDAARTTGLTTVFEQAYVQDNLAVRYTALPQWLGVSPTSGRIPAGGQVPLSVRIDAARLEGGTYPGRIDILNNDPAHPTVSVDVTLVVTGAPEATVSPGSLVFGDRFLAFPHILDLIVANVGTDTLHVSSIASASPDLTAAPGAFDVPAHDTRSVTVTWTPSGLGPFSSSLTINSDDAGEPVITVPVTGNVIPAPIVVVNPTSLVETLSSGNTSTQTLTVSNAGGSDLIVTAGADQGNGGNGIVVVNETGLGNGGPDAFGYRWRDSDASGGPPFVFTDISATGTPIVFSSADNALSPVIDMGMSFPFYGNTFGSMKVSTNGWLTFDTTATVTASVNANLPSTSLPRNSIAMFWDNLHLRAGNVTYRSDGSRFIVQYTSVGLSTPSTGQDFTFQVQLHPNGRILLLYRTMTGTLTSATIGIQDQNRTTALAVNFNSAYVHNDLAVQISRTPDWLSVTPAGATIPPGGSHAFDVRFDATDRPGGQLQGNVVLTTNIPGEATVLVPATLNVLGASQVTLVPASIGYGTVFIGYPQLTSFLVINDGSEVLNVSNVTTTDPSLTVEEPPGPSASFQLAPGASRIMNLRWAPALVGALDARVDVLSDDPDTPVASIAVTGSASVAPVAVYAPSSLSESLDVGDIVTRSLHLENQGGSDLTFATVLRLLTGAAVTVHPDLELDKGESDPRPGMLGSGGPDLFGYRWRDSDAPDGPEFAFVDISAIGTPIAALTGDDQDAGPVPIGFDFPFYGTTFNSVRVKTNGFLSFTSTLTDTSNDPLPSTGGPPNLLAVFWDDLNFRNALRARYLSDGTRFIVQWTDVDRHSTAEPPSPAHLTFQAILYPNGRIVFQYATMTGFLTSATIGIQNAARNDGLQVVFNAAYMHDDLAIEFRPPKDFLSVSPARGTIAAGGAADLAVQLDASHLIGGDYSALIDLLTNDPARPLISVPVSLHVTGIPDIDAQPASLAFPNTFVGFGRTLPLVVKNVGTDVLTLSAVSVTGDFTQTGLSAPVSLPVGASIPVSVLFTPSVAGLRTGSITIASNDPDEASLGVPLQGLALIPPRVGAAPASISTALPPGGTRTKTVTIHNSGGSDLHWTTGTDIASAVTPGTSVELAKDEVDTREGTLGSGGPDLFGYRWRDSDAPIGPAFDWVDISGVGTPITTLDGDDENSGPIPIGFPFRFYGNTFNEVRVTTNGWVSFTSTRTTFTNQPLPNSGTTVPENLIAAFWDDLDFRGALKAHYYNDGTRFIVQWTDVDRHVTPAGNSHLTFQVQLYPSGRILLQYLTMTSPVLNSATIGIQNAAKDDGLTAVFNAAYVHDGLAIEIKPIPQWLTVDPSGGTVPAGGSQPLLVRLNAAGLEDGVHEAFIDVSSNDPYTPKLSVPVRLNAGLVEPTMVAFEPETLNLSSNGGCVKVVVELPAGLDPRAINLASLTLNGSVPYPAHPCGALSYSDVDVDGIEEAVLKFDRARLEAVVSVGDSVPVTIQGEVTDVQWFRGTTMIRVIDPARR
jgi:subtilisin family serine protease